MAGKLTLKLLVPTRAAASREVDSINLTAMEGEVGILPGHAALLAALKPGPAAVRDGSAVEHWALGEGVLEIHDDVVTVLARSAERSDEIDVDRARRRLAEREAEIAREHASEIELKRAELSLAKQLVRIRVAEMGS